MEEDSADGRETIVNVDAWIPNPPFRRREAKFHVTTKTHPISDQHFGDRSASAAVRRSRTKRRHRIVYLSALPTAELYAAVAIHVSDDRRVPVMLTHVLERTDTAEAAELSRELVGFILPFLVEASAQAHRPPEVCAVVEPTEDATVYVDLEFREATPPPGTIRRGATYLVYRDGGRRRRS